MNTTRVTIAALAVAIQFSMAGMAPAQNAFGTNAVTPAPIGMNGTSTTGLNAGTAAAANMPVGGTITSGTGTSLTAGTGTIPGSGSSFVMPGPGPVGGTISGVTQGSAFGSGTLGSAVVGTSGGAAQFPGASAGTNATVGAAPGVLSARGNALQGNASEAFTLQLLRATPSGTIAGGNGVATGLSGTVPDSGGALSLMGQTFGFSNVRLQLAGSGNVSTFSADLGGRVGTGIAVVGNLTGAIGSQSTSGAGRVLASFDGAAQFNNGSAWHLTGTVDMGPALAATGVTSSGQIVGNK